MAKFILGQKVRIISSRTRPDLVGTASTITQCVFDKSARGGWEYFYGLDVSPLSQEGIIRYGWADWQLEPILDQHQSCESDFKASLDRLVEGLPA